MSHERNVEKLEARGAMTVLDLRAMLADMPADAVVVFGADYGDLCNTEQALPVTECEVIDNHMIDTSGYSNSGFSIEPARDDDGDHDEDAYRTDVVVLR
jgi:hypothetical protein